MIQNIEILFIYFQGMKVTCKLTVQNRQAKIEVVPSAASLICRELNEEDGDRSSGRNCELLLT